MTFTFRTLRLETLILTPVAVAGNGGRSPSPHRRTLGCWCSSTTMADKLLQRVKNWALINDFGMELKQVLTIESL